MNRYSRARSSAGISSEIGARSTADSAWSEDAVPAADSAARLGGLSAELINAATGHFDILAVTHLVWCRKGLVVRCLASGCTHSFVC
jgi:hypothetical protein